MKKRVESVDILRGLTIAAMILVNTPGTWSSVYAPFLHAEWHGLTPTDLIFPFFIFIVGISISFAYKNKKLDNQTFKKISIRSLKLVGLGLFLNWFLPYFPFFKDFETLRFLGVLQRIGIVFFISALLFLQFNWKVLLSIAIAILVFYWVLLGFIPLPDGTLPSFDRVANNWALYIDSNLLGKHMWKSDYDPEGFLSTLPAVAGCLFGILTGNLLASKNEKKLQLLLYSSLICLVLGYVWHLVFPINKALWTSSFVVVTTGWALLFLMIVYYLTDVKNIKFGGIFKQVGMNAIIVYFLSSFITKIFYLTKVNSNETVHGWIYNHLFTHSFIDAKLSSLLYALAVTAFYLFLGYILYRKKIFIKV